MYIINTFISNLSLVIFYQDQSFRINIKIKFLMLKKNFNLNLYYEVVS